MEDSITVTGARDAMRKRQERDVSYPQAGARTSSPVRPRVSFAEDEDMIVQEPPESPNTLNHSPEQQEEAESSEEEEEDPPAKKKARAS